MTFKHWLRQAFGSQAIARASRRGSSSQSSRLRFTPRAELLEARLAPAVLTVTSNADSGAGTLRAAIEASVKRTGGGTGNDTIRFAPALDGQTITLSTFANDLTKGTRIAGPSAFVITNGDVLVIDGQTGLTKGIAITRSSADSFRFFDVDSTSSLTLQSLTLSGGAAAGFNGGDTRFSGGGGGGASLGGAIFNQGNLKIMNSTLTGNTAQGGAGGRIDRDFNTVQRNFRFGPGGGGGGLGAAGGKSNQSNYTGAGGSNDGIGKFGGGGDGGGHGSNLGANPALIPGGAGGFGGGGGGGGYSSSGYDASAHGNGGAGGFGGGGGGLGGTFFLPGPITTTPGAGGFGVGAGFGTAGGGGAGLGGAVFNEAGSVIITNSTIAGNKASGGAGARDGQGLGGGVFNHNGIITITSSTFSDNTAAQGGRGIYNLGDADGASATITNSILGQGDTALPDLVVNKINGGSSSVGGSTNLIRTTTVLNGATDSLKGTLTTDPLLATLGKYGGPTSTLALLPGSPALDAGTSVSAPTADQRGVSRVGNVDIGAFESRGFTIAATSGSGQSTALFTGFAAPVVATVTANNASEPVKGGLVSFIAPTSGALASLSASPATISASGTASVNATANGLVGAYTVSASFHGSPLAASFSLSNTRSPASFSQLSSPDIIYGTPTTTLGGHVGWTAHRAWG